MVRAIGVAVNSAQIENTPIRGRGWMGLMQPLPGVVDLNSHNESGWNSGNPTINGGQTGQSDFDFSLLKDIRLAESKTLEFRAEAYNVFNRFNPGHPNTSLSLNYASGANTNANFGTITTLVGQARHMTLALKLRF